MLPLKSTWLRCLGGGLLALTLTGSALRAQDSGPLLDLLVKKGIVTDQEAEELRAELVKDFATSSPAGKLNLSSGLTELKISGDARVRYEHRTGENAAGDNIDRGRWRYRLRPAITGTLGSQWFFGLRIENGGGNRSSNVTFGDDGGPWAKTNDGFYAGQVYIGFKPTNAWTLYAGRIPNPFVTTSMVWDGDINPEGFAEKFTYAAGPVSYFVNLGQFIYDSANPQNALAPAVNRKDQYMLGWQAGATVKFDERNSLTVAPTLYHYVNNERNAKTFAGSFSPGTQNAINNLMIAEVPFTLATTLPNGAAASVFGDVAYNFDGDDRARKYGRPDLDSEALAWQLGAQYGKAKNRGEWDLKAFYQATGLFALDPNLVDSDLFDSRVNTKGWVVGLNYLLSDAVTFTVTYADAKTKDTSAISAGSGDIGIPSLRSFGLLQFDIVAKF
ncbi:putative porin [Opitutus terrae]|uniref:Porin n=1 Tax=Opitutus terrae (strain DSM 11246 / JCM 15787 / PB90-1) TaxID=452637 RepID=B1ZT37_OPITP|nr:putative porin [Opitutus terrae]ACB75826.1 hypothetical protein Oter_2544 [Opitutus terrae PB90-1]